MERLNGGVQELVHRVFRADLRRPGEAQKEKHRELLSQLRQASFLCAQYGNECLTANYLLYRHKGFETAESGALLEALQAEQREAKGRYRAWADKLSSNARDAITRAVSGLVKARGREVLRGEASLPTFQRRGAIRVRDKGVRLWREKNGRLFCALNIEPSIERERQWIEFELWVKNLHKSPRYQAVLEHLLDGSYKIGQAQLLIVEGYRVSLRILYEAPVEAAAGERVGEVVATENGLGVKIGEWVAAFDFDVLEAARRKQAIEARRVQCWRVLRGRRLRRRRARIYRSGTLSALSMAWQNYQRTWCQQLAAAVAERCIAAGVSRLAVPSAGAFAEAFVTVIEFGQLSGAIRNACEWRGIAVSQITTEAEQKKALRKKEAEQKRIAAKNQANAEGLQHAARA